MPTYSFECPKCGPIDLSLSVSDMDNIQRCTICGGEMVRVFSPPTIIFKGKGFYKNDSRPTKIESNE